MAQSCIINYHGNLVTFYYERHKDGRCITETMSAIDFIKHLIIHIPDEQFKLVRYYGLYTKKHKHSSQFFLLTSLSKNEFLQEHSDWCILLAFGTAPLQCSYGGKMALLYIFTSSKSSLLGYFPPPPL